ncbi:hypothetical protein QVD17_26761 [Tagetes erecta]|uniref:Uncharacterized protein n=1 Tax=Tagetes erecta TaxID=13708 RepID=A0AAD8NR44_TARER|nr:hypothetical protein QVD17_26761 [Tagetes erecta]
MVHNNSKFDLNKNPAAVISCNDEFDTALRLECLGHGSISRASSRNQDAPNNGCALVLGLGPTPSANEQDLVLRLGVSNQYVTSKSDMKPFVGVSNGVGFDHVVVVDDGSSSTSVKRSGGYMPSLVLAPRISVPLRKLHISEPAQSSSLCKARGDEKRFLYKRVQENKNGLQVFYRPVLVSGLGHGSTDNHLLSGSSGISNSTGWLGKPAKRRQLIPPQVLVPSSMKSSSYLASNKQSRSATDNNDRAQKSLGLEAPTARVNDSVIDEI